LYLDDIGNIGQDALFINVPSVIINLVKSSDRATSLAQPQMRITEGEKGSVHIGQREPIPVTSFNTAYQGQPGAITPVTSFQYQDVGIKIDVEPRVHHNREVTLTLTVEVSSITGERTSGNQTLPVIGTRTINTVIRLRDGETNMLVGLYKEDSTTVNTETPGLSAIPFLGRLFTSKKKERKTTDLVLTLTPHIIRFPDIREEDLAPVWVGTESRISFSGSRSPRIESGRVREGPFDQSEERQRPQRPTPRVGTPAERSFGAPRRVTPTPQPQGIELVPQPRDKRNEPTPDPGAAPPNDAFLQLDDASRLPLVMGLEPSVVSLTEGELTVLQLVVRDAPTSYRLPMGISYDPGRLIVETFEPAPGVEVVDGSIDDSEGWLSLDLVVAEGRETAHALAALRVRAAEAGPAPLIFTVGMAELDDGSAVPVATSDGALFISPASVARGP
jgi:general secretion pathway protein D